MSRSDSSSSSSSFARPIDRSSLPSPRTVPLGASAGGGPRVGRRGRCGGRARLDGRARGGDATGDVLLDHLLDLVLPETRGERDLGRRGFARRLVGGRDVHDAVGVDLEGHVDLHVRPQALLEARELELTEHRVVGGLAVVALIDADAHRFLMVLDGRERARLLDRDRRVSLDHRLGESAPPPRSAGRGASRRAASSPAPRRPATPRGSPRPSKRPRRDPTSTRGSCWK